MRAASWRRHWAEVMPFYDYPPEIRKRIDTTNAMESLNLQVRKVVKNRGHVPSEQAAGIKGSVLTIDNVMMESRRSKC